MKKTRYHSGPRCSYVEIPITMNSKPYIATDKVAQYSLMIKWLRDEEMYYASTYSSQ